MPKSKYVSKLLDWDVTPIDQRRRLLRMSDLWDGNTYAMLKWKDMPQHIQLKIDWILNYAGLYAEPTL